MSNESNSALFARAYEVAEEMTNHPSGIDVSILKAIEDNDLDNLRYLVTKAEGELARQHFYGHNMIEPTEIY